MVQPGNIRRSRRSFLVGAGAVGVAGVGAGMPTAWGAATPNSTPVPVVPGLTSLGWLVPDGLSTTDPSSTTAGLRAAVDSFAGSPGVLSIPPSPAGTPWLFGDVLDFKNVDVRGCGGGFAQQATIFQATNSAAQFSFSGGGSQTQDFKIDGAGVAYTPFVRAPKKSATSSRRFSNIIVTRNADNGTGTNPLCSFMGAQNDVYEMFHMTAGANDIASFDGGFGGATFSGCEISTAGISLVMVNAGYNITFDGTDVCSTNPLSGPLVDIGNGGQITFRNGALQEVGAAALQPGTVGFRVSGTSSLILEGRLSYTNLATCLVVDGLNAYVDDKAATFQARVGARASFINGANSTQVAGVFNNGVGLLLQGAAQPALTSYTAQRGALLYTMLASGQQKYYPGTGFTPDVVVGRMAPGTWGVSGQSYSLGTGYGLRGGEGPAYPGNLYVDTANGVVEVSDGINWRSSAPYGTWTPSDNKLASCSFDPALASSTYLSLPSGAAAYVRLKVPAGAVISTVHAWIGTPGITLTASSATIYDTTGALIGATKDQSSAWASSGKKAMPLVTAIAAQTRDRVVYVALYAAGRTLPKLVYNGGTTATDFGMTTGPYACGKINRSTTTPSTVNLSTMATYYNYLVGLA